jgi:hypothetical protein
MAGFKRIDFWVSIVLITIFIIIAIFKQDFALGFKIDEANSFIAGYIFVGLWQVISMIVHLFNKKIFPLSFVRKVYSIITFLCLATMPMGLLMPTILLLTAPFMAIFYTCLCGIETFRKIKRPIDVLR